MQTIEQTVHNGRFLQYFRAERCDLWSFGVSSVNQFILKQPSNLMRSFILFLLFGGAASLSGAQAQNSLANTAWQGTAVQLYWVMDVVLQFDKDTIRMYSVPDNVLPETKLLETMTYTTKGDTLTWKKASGSSPCDEQTPGTWRYTIRNNEMTLNRVDDACEGRSNAFTDKPFKKVAVPVK